MSSALLYLAIVVVWGMVLVPMWLHRESTHHHGARGRLFNRRRTTAETEDNGTYDEELSDTTTEGIVRDAETETVLGDGHTDHRAHGQTDDRARDHADERGHGNTGTRGYAYAGGRGDDHASPDPRVARPPGPSRRHDIATARRRAKIIARRRRRTTLLLTLTIATAVLAATDLTPWWIVPTPVLLLAGHLTLLRAAAAADAQHARAEAARRAAQRRRHEATRTAEQTRTAEETRSETTMVHPTAEIIDFAAHAREEIYDQYADAEKRAVND